MSVLSFPTAGQTSYSSTVKSYIDGSLAATNVLNPTYGADNTGTNDVTTAVHAARDSGAKAILFPPGTYKTTGLTANVTGQTWILAPGAVINVSTTAHTVTVAASGVTIQGPGLINNVTLSGKASVFIQSGLTDVSVLGVELANSSYGVQVKSATGSVTSRVRVNGCHIHDTSAHGVFFNWETTDSEISFNNIHTTGTNGNGIWFGNNSHRNRVVGNSIVSPSRMGIESFGGNNECVIADNTIYQPGTIGISLDTNTGTRVIGNSVNTPASYGVELAGSNSCVVQGNYLLSPTVGVSISAPSGTCNDNLVAANTIITPSSNGINAGGVANGAQRLRVIGNEIVDAGNGAGSVSAIACTTGIGCADLMVANNVIRWTISASSCSGINPNSPGALITGNLIIHDSGMASSGGTGINLASTCLDSNVTGNIVEGNGKCSNGIVLASSVTGCLVADNKITGTTSNMLQNNNSTSASNQLAGNIGAVTSGAGITYGAASYYGNRSSTSGINFAVSGATTTTAPGAGGAGALPATPAGYLTLPINGTNRQIPYY